MLSVVSLIAILLLSVVSQPCLVTWLGCLRYMGPSLRESLALFHGCISERETACDVMLQVAQAKKDWAAEETGGNEHRTTCSARIRLDAQVAGRKTGAI